MKILIDIPEDTHERITRPDRLFTDDDVNKICWAVYNGIPIPDNVPTVEVLEQIRTEIYQLHCHPKLDFIKTDEVVDMALDIIDNYREEQTDAT